MGKRIHPIKVLLDDEELADLQRLAIALDLPASEIVRRGWLLSIRGSLGLAEARAKRNRGSDAAPLTGEDFVTTGLGDLL